MMLHTRRRGFTLVEVLVVITILGLLMGIVIPAVQSVRGAARRMECLSRISQVGSALQNFEHTYRYFPAAHLGFQTPQGGFEYYSPIAHLLPYIDQGVIYNRINFRSGNSFSVDPQPLGIADQGLKVLLCPSDLGEFGCNFRFCTGNSAYAFRVSTLAPSDGAFGAFTRFETHTTSDFTDGMSHTIGVSEKIKSPGRAGGWSPNSQFWYSAVADLLGYYPRTDVVVATCESLTSTPPEYGWHAGNNWLMGYYDFTLYNHAVVPNSAIPDCSIHGGGIPVPAVDADAGVFAARSYHSGGVNCLLMDGSGRFVSNNIDLGVWQALSTRASGETIDEF